MAAYEPLASGAAEAATGSSFTWPMLDVSSQARIECAQIALCLHQTYHAVKERNEIPAKITFEGHDVPIFNRPPSFLSEFVLSLETEAQKPPNPTFNMCQAVCIVDEENQSARGADTVLNERGFEVYFSGPKDMTVFPYTSDTGFSVGRRGCGTIPSSSLVKPWRFDVLKVKEVCSKWYICLYIPIRPREKRKRRQSVTPGTETDAGVGHVDPGEVTTSVHDSSTDIDPKIAAVVDQLTELLIQNLLSAGKLASPEEQEEKRKSIKITLSGAIQPFAVHNLSPEWPDYVFKDTYGRLTLVEVFEHITDKGCLPWVRSERSVQETGVDLVRDHVNLLEAVENLFLYIRDMDQKSAEDKEKLRQLERLWWSSDTPLEVSQARKRLRGACWKALREDDPEALLLALEEGACKFKVSSDELMVLMQHWLWKGDKGKGPSGQALGVIVAAASNKVGVPLRGAVRCLQALLLRFPSDSDACSNTAGQLAEALARARAMGTQRAEAVEILLRHHVGATEDGGDRKSVV